MFFFLLLWYNAYMKVLDVKWFSSVSCVGIVKAYDEYKGILYYIGNASSVNEEFDADYIMKWGAKFPKEAGDQLFGV